MPDLFLVTGPSAAGKSTIADLLARRYTRGVHVEGDIYRRSIVSGREEMTPSEKPEALAQLRLRYRLAIGAAQMYHAAGFTAVFDDVAAGPMLMEVVEMLSIRPLHVVVLMPGPPVVARRAAGRGGWRLSSLGCRNAGSRIRRRDSSHRALATQSFRRLFIGSIRR